MVNSLKNLSEREQKILLYAVPLVIVLLLYFFVIDLNHKKYTTIQGQIKEHQKRIPKMQQMAETILETKGVTQTAQEIIGEWLDKQSMIDGKVVLISKPLPPDVAKELIRKLYTKGQTKLIEKDRKITLWHQVN